MRGRITYILVVLLFVMTGALCRQQTAAQTAGSSDRSILTRRASSQEHDQGRFGNHSFIVPEIVCEIHAERHDQKASFRHPVLTGSFVAAEPVAAAAPVVMTVDLHPDPVGYYVFSLEKIRI